MEAALLRAVLRKLYQARDRFMDKVFRKGVDFASWVDPDENEAKTGNRYQPTGFGLRSYLRGCDISGKDAILDLGCGKGKAMYYMADFPFGKVEGYDRDDNLVRIANDNFKKLGIRCHAFTADALEYDDYDRFNYFYLYNPFPDEVVKTMLKHVENSVARKPRKCILIYMNPVCHDVIVNNSKFRMVKERKRLISWFTIRQYEM